MTWLWQLVLSFLVWLSADPRTIATEPARAAAAVAAARATLVGEGVSDSSVEGMATIKTPLFDAHAAKCKRCYNRNPNGPGLCEEGFRLLQQDMRAGKTCATGTCQKETR